MGRGTLAPLGRRMDNSFIHSFTHLIFAEGLLGVRPSMKGTVDTALALQL